VQEIGALSSDEAAEAAEHWRRHICTRRIGGSSNCHARGHRITQASVMIITTTITIIVITASLRMSNL
jgi:hypothetical protein